MIRMDSTAGLGDANGGQYYGVEQSYGTDQLYREDSSAYGDYNGRRDSLVCECCVTRVNSKNGTKRR